MEITLDWLVNHSSLENIKLLTCQDKLSTPITGVNMLDNPDPLQWIKPGEIVLTTGYVIKDNPDLQIQILDDLKQTGCAALCLKTKRFFQEFPEHMLQYAEEIGLPMIELPYYYSLAFISDEIRQQIFLTQFEKATAEQTLFNTLFNSYFEGKSLNEILQIFSDYIQSSIFILNTQNQALWYALTPEDAKKEYFIPPFPSLTLTKPSYTNNSIYLSGKLTLDQHELSIALLPFSTPKYTLCILHEHPELLPWQTIQHVLKIIDFSRMNSSFRHSTVTNYYDSFFQYLMNADNFSETSVIQLCEYYGLPVPPHAICMVFRNRKKEENFQPQKVISLIKNNLPFLSTASCFTAYNENLVCLCLFPAMEKHVPKLRDALNDLLQSAADKYIIGISSQVCSPLPNAFEEASFMLALHKYFPDEKLFFFQDYLIFWRISKMTEEEKQSIYQVTVKPLIEFDAKNHTNLTDTIWMYFCCHLNSSHAAKKLFIHRNTFLKRMDKIKSILNLSTEHPSSLFSIYLGLCIHLTLNQ